MEKGKLMMVIIMVLLVALLGTIVAVAVIAFPLLRGIQQQDPVYGDMDFRPGPPVLSVEDIKRVEIPQNLTNLARETEGRDRFIRVQTAVGIDNTQGRDSEKMVAVIENDVDFIQSIVLDELRNTTYEELSQPGSHSQLAERILYRIQTEYQSNMIVAVYFLDWLIS
jgi:flagellar basal body-associated protein FliL